MNLWKIGEGDLKKLFDDAKLETLSLCKYFTADKWKLLSINSSFLHSFRWKCGVSEVQYISSFMVVDQFSDISEICRSRWQIRSTYPWWQKSFLSKDPSDLVRSCFTTSQHTLEQVRMMMRRVSLAKVLSWYWVMAILRLSSSAVTGDFREMSFVLTW